MEACAGYRQDSVGSGYPQSSVSAFLSLDKVSVLFIAVFPNFEFIW
jgi:hypothetical protein